MLYKLDDLVHPYIHNIRVIIEPLFEVKNRTPLTCKSVLHQLTDMACEFGCGPSFNQILPLLMSPTMLKDQEHNSLIKVINSTLYKLNNLVHPYMHEILVVIKLFLIDEYFYACVETREIVSNLIKTAVLSAMIATIRPNINNLDKCVCDTTARAFSIIAATLIPALLPFLKAMCQSKKSWQARYTGIKIIQQITILMGRAILSHLKGLVIIPLMDAEYGSYCAKEVMVILICGHCSHALDRYSLLCTLGISYSLSLLFFLLSFSLSFFFILAFILQ
jgi:splicing factor 3B subunit 1